MSEKYDIYSTCSCAIDLNTNKPISDPLMVVTESELNVLKRFASTEKDSELNTIYTLNNVEFRVYPHIENK